MILLSNDPITITITNPYMILLLLLSLLSLMKVAFVLVSVLQSVVI